MNGRTKTHCGTRWDTFTVVAVLLVYGGTTFAHGQSGAGANPPSKASRLGRTADGHPDFNGIWTKVGGGITEKNPPYTPLTQTEFQTFAYPSAFGVFTVDSNNVVVRLEDPNGGDSGRYSRRLQRPTGVVDPADRVLPWRPEADAARRAYLAKMNPPASIDYVQFSSRCALGGESGPFAEGTVQILQRPKSVLMMIEHFNKYRSIPLDGRAHIGSGMHLFMGDPVGSWEGDTLVVDTTNFNGKIEFEVYTYFPYFSDALHTIERFTPVDANTIDYEITYDDPKLFTRPIKSVGYFMRADKGAEILEYGCWEGSHTLPNIFGF